MVEEQERSFQEIVSGKEQYEVCRLFLASLQLVRGRGVRAVGIAEGLLLVSTIVARRWGVQFIPPPSPSIDRQANNGNVQLVHEAGPKDKDGLSFRLNLLSDQRMHERFVGERGHASAR